MNVLSIGNSFSQDAQRYLHQIAKADGVLINCFNLYIPGCPLSTHHKNMLSEEKAYILEMNGESTGFFVSLKEALINREWDVITIQQVSDQAPYYDTFQPYLNEVIVYVRKLAPNAKIAIHQTWAYEQGSYRLNVELGYNSYKDMLSAAVSSYKKAAKDICADFIIPSGELLGALLENGIKKIHRDSFHASLGLGRYALGLEWYHFLTGNDISKNPFNDLDEEISAEEFLIAKKCVLEISKKYVI